MRLHVVLNREFLTLFLVFLVLASIVAFVLANPPANEDFASLSVLGSGRTAAFYFPNNDTSVRLSEQIQWYLQVYNHERDAQLYSLHILIGNLTTTTDNSTSHIPSGGVRIAQYYSAMENGQTWTLPLSWSITNELSAGGTTTIQSLIVNNQPVSVGLSAFGGKNFRIVIELWSYNVDAHGYIFSYLANGSLDSVFNQIWFNTA